VVGFPDAFAGDALGEASLLLLILSVFRRALWDAAPAIIAQR